jgi:mannose-6-phosphate isomerase-like protein (cupin superfamily)
MKKLACLILALPLFAADPAGFVIWKSRDLAQRDKTLAPKIDAQKVATEQLANFGNHTASITHREGDGIAEIHDKMSDLFVVQTGEATLVIGGTVPGVKETAPGEKRGPAIQGGDRKELRPGDVVHIPPGVPHQLLVAKGKTFTYFVLKVASN